ncbi:FAD-dependent oxidoreductase [Lacrimispora saccharolytica]|uniref:FAD-dependent pyridine nucleotide-disulfide oxidoreductase n=1 Tax=Lacrimispora saccharolytica (strain ATCC 35040 / DSM 2544 / NRCC 2533 / WM1) TaxID=610130 RepID=D9R6Q4_LACSW|nr:FAD-dependent oxidoreductase [Lacrimispora saccharolytica]ADL03560.1 FAD-dependent pyridine nucleotide-disulfide oxidoreductase [[Clostridium] saccharolyticum WM1]QRV18294.1 FAD-dependent oxidoreductase [Lacrimispora saccharolytica]
MGKRVLIVGGVAGGASAAARIRRLDADASITILERGEHVSFSNCSLPYYLSRTVEDKDELVLMTPEGFKNSYDIEVRVNSEVCGIDRTLKKIRIKDRVSGREYEESYDELVLSPGSYPIRPNSIEGVTLPHVFTVRNVKDIETLDQYISREEVRRVVVIGGGFIGLEVAENLKSAGKQVAVAEAANQIMAPFDYDMSQILQKELYDQGVELAVGDGVKAITEDKVILNSGRELPCDAVVLSIGVLPETELAKQAGLETGETGAIKVAPDYRTSDPHIYAVGDAIEVYQRLTHKPIKLPLAGPALRQARAAADAMYGMPSRNNGVIGSCAVRLFRLNAAATGLNERTAKANNIPCDFVYTIAMDKVGLMPGSSPMHFKLVFEVPTGRILGAQAIGKGSVDKRIDVIATLIAMNGTLEDLKDLELCYSPVFGTARDVVNLAALVALNVLHGVVKQVPVSNVRELVESKACIIDVRSRDEFEMGHLIGAVNIPLGELRQRISEIPHDRPVFLHCRTSQRSYNAAMALKGRGFDNVLNISGSFLGISYYEYFTDMTTGREKILTEYNFL